MSSPVPSIQITLKFNSFIFVERLIQAVGVEGDLFVFKNGAAYFLDEVTGKYHAETTNTTYGPATPMRSQNGYLFDDIPETPNP